MREACRLAVEVAAAGEQADPRVPAPAEMRPVLGFSRLSAAAYRVIGQVVDDDGVFRARVAEEATEEAVGRAGWLWLHRPVGWAEDAAFEEPDQPKAERKHSDQSKAKAALAEAEAARRAVAAQLNDAKAAIRAHDAEREALEERIAALEAERSAAMRLAKSTEADLSRTRHELRIARESAREAEAEMLSLRSAQPLSAEALSPVPAAAPAAPAAPVASPAPAIPAELADAVRSASAAAADLSAALATAAGVLGTSSEAVVEVDDAPRPPAPHRRERGTPGRRPRPAATRRLPLLPPGVFDGTAEAHRRVIGDASNLVIVDGYNVARCAWSDLPIVEERQRTVALLEDVQARSGGSIVVVFDGDDSVVAPRSSRAIRVCFSATGETADEVIARMVAGVPATKPVVVVSSDREVVRDATACGAVTIGSRDFLTAAGR